MSESKIPVPVGKAINLADQVEYVKNTVTSKTIIKGKTGAITVFSFDANEGLSEHSAPFDAFVTILEGEGEITIGGKVNIVKEGETIIMPANIPHSIHGNEPFKMLLVMIKG